MFRNRRNIGLECMFLFFLVSMLIQLVPEALLRTGNLIHSHDHHKRTIEIPYHHEKKTSSRSDKHRDLREIIKGWLK